MKNIISILTALLITQMGLAQQRAITHELDADLSGASKHYVARETIKLKKGFSYKSQSGKKFKGQLRNFELAEMYENTLTSPTGGSNNTGEVGDTPGVFQVNAAGAMTYTVPIKVVPGTADMEPNLSIIYNSQAGDGLMGKGFSLAGLSAISRVQSTKFHDGEQDPVDFDDKDRLALDGQRLILVSGTYGAANSEYRTEHNRFAKIVAYGTVGTSGYPEKFKVWEKSGLIKEYGYTTSSQIGDVEKGYLTWLLNKIEDRKGNYMTVEYHNSATEHYPTRISYTGNINEGLAPYASVEFTYEDRAIERSQYGCDDKQAIRKQLTNITSKYGTSVLRSYQLEYIVKDDVPHVQSLTEQNGSGDKFNPIRFEWNHSRGSFTSTSTTLEVTPTITAYNATVETDHRVGDFDGDGVSELLVFKRIKPYQQSEQNTWELYEIQGGQMTLANSGNLSGASTHYKFYTGDFNGDGLTDFMEVKKADPADYKVFISSGNDFSLGWSGQFNQHEWLYQADFDGDGRSDIMLMNIYPTWDGKVFLQGQIQYGGTSAFDVVPASYFGWISDHQGLDGSEMQLSDYNADGRTDIFVGLSLASSSWLVADGVVTNYSYSSFQGSTLLTSTATRWTFDISSDNAWPKLNTDYISQNLVHGDFNGDGRVDLLLKNRVRIKIGENIYSYHWRIYFGNDNGFTEVTVDDMPGMDSGYTLQVADTDGDGLTELIFIPEESTGRISIHELSGTSWRTLASRSKAQINSQLITSDFTGNGTSDLLEIGEVVKTEVLTTGICGTEVVQGEEPEYLPCHTINADQTYYLNTDWIEEKPLVRTITNSLGSLILVDYAPLTDNDVYTRYNHTNDDILSAQFPMYVVASAHIDNGLGEWAEMRYHYKGASIHRAGRGLLGFQKIIATDVAAGLKTTTQYSYANAGFVNLLDQQDIRSIHTGQLLSHLDINYIALNDGYAGTYVYVKDDEAMQTYDPTSGQLLSTSTADYKSYDADGNVLEILQTSGSGHTVRAVNTYKPANTADWIIGRLATAQVTRTAPGQAAETRSSEFTYDSDGLLKTETLEPGHTLELKTTYAYDGFGNVSQVTIEGLGGTRTAQTIYTSDGRFVDEIHNALGYKTAFDYDPVSGNGSIQTDPNGLVTTYEFDYFHRLTKVITPYGEETITQYSWEVSGGPMGSRYAMTLTDGDGRIQKTFFDRLSRGLRTQVSAFDGSMISKDQFYDTKGQTVQQSEPYASGETVLWNKVDYDNFGRPTKRIAPGDRTTSLSFNQYTSTATNANGQSNSRTVNAVDQLTKSTDANSQPLTYTYHSNGQVHTITDPKGNVTTIEYDLLGNRTKVIDPDLGTTTYMYNAYGELIEQTDGQGVVITFSYDALGRPLLRTVAKDGVVESTDWIYDTQWKGAISMVTHTNGTIRSFEYDHLGRVTKDSETIEGQVYDTHYTYTTDGKLDVLTYPSGFEIKHLYNVKGFLQSVKNNDQTITYWEAGEQNARGQWESFTLGNGVEIERAYDSNTGLLQAIQARLGQTVLQNMAFSYDPVFNLISRTDHLADGGLGLTETFAYDNLNRLIRSEITGKNYGALDMTYDELGNLKYKSDVGYYHYEGTKPHAVSRVDNTGGSIPSTVQTISYTGFNKVSLITEGFSALEFIYGAGHERKVTKTYLDGSLTQTKVFVGLYEKQINAAGEDRELHYIQGGSGLIAIHTIEGNNESTSYLLKDHLGTIAGIMDETGTVQERYSYDAWGNRRDVDTWDTLAGNINDAFDRGFTGHEHLHLFALINMNGRVYDPVLGRFLSADPVTPSWTNLQALNRYSYVFNNPLSFTDPSGHVPIILAPIIITATKITTAVVIAKAVAVTATIVATTLAINAATSSAAVNAALAGSAYAEPGVNYGYFNDATGAFSNDPGSNFLIQGNNPPLSNAPGLQSATPASPPSLATSGPSLPGALPGVSMSTPVPGKAGLSYLWGATPSAAVTAGSGIVQANWGSEISRNPFDWGTSISVAGNLTILGGLQGELGVAWDSSGDYTVYFSFGGTVGVDASIGLLTKHYAPVNPRIGFDVTDLKGYGSATSVAIGWADGTYGGDLDSNGTNPFDLGNSYTETGAGASYGLPLGLTWSLDYTWLLTD